MSKLAAALAWARRGFPVFPLVPNGKEPAFGDSWYDISTTDEAAIRAMWVDPILRIEQDYNIGVDCTGRIVVDVDVKDGKNGYNEYCSIVGTNEWDTLTVRTPTGGYHVYYDGEDAGNSSISAAVDIRSHHGYVVGPGSTINGVPYSIVRDVEPSWVPTAVYTRLAPVEQRRDFVVSDGDSEAAIQAAINYLITAPPAIEGQRGDETTYIVAARLVRELGLSEYTALNLLAEHYNPRCMPPWSLDELRQKVENASTYGTAGLGRLDPALLFGGLPLTPPPSVFAQAGLIGDTALSSWGNALDPEATPERPWMIDRILMVGETTLVIAAGSVGKSTLGLVIAAHLAMGVDIGPYKVHTRCRTVIYNGEDDRTEQSRRLQAVCALYNFPYSEVRQYVKLLDNDDIDLMLVVRAGGGATENTALVDQLIQLLSDPSIGLFIGDPIGDLHSADENSPSDMNLVIRTLKKISRHANVASLIMTHSTKGNDTDRVGNMDILRGTSATAYKARIALTLVGASEDDAEAYGMQPEQIRSFIRMDDAKMNLSLKGEQMLWFKREGIKIANGETIGALRHTELTNNTMFIQLRIAGRLIDNMVANNQATMTISQAVALLKQTEPLWANRTDSEIKQRLEGMFGVLTEVQGKKLQVKRNEAGEKPVVVLS